MGAAAIGDERAAAGSAGGSAGGGGFTRNSVSVAAWTAVSRVTGFARVAAVAAVLGPTYLGNIYQATNNVPNLAYMLLTGALFTNLLVPPLVRHVDAGDRVAAERLAGAFLTTVLVVFSVGAAPVVLTGPLLLRVLSVGVEQPAVATEQRRAGLILLVLFMPQLALYAVVGTAEAVMNAHGRFALASAAPALENIGIIATLAVVGLRFGTGTALDRPGNGALVCLGVGTTGAVALHAAVQWFGARRVGFHLRPRAGWRDPEVRAVLKRAVPSFGYSGLDVLQRFGATVVANRVPGGVVAVDVAFNFYMLPSALAARPVSVALLPRLARLYSAGRMRAFRDDLVRGAALTAFLTVPAAVSYVVLAVPLARAVSFGDLADRMQALVTPALLGLAPGVLGSGVLLLATYASYARRDARAPFSAARLRIVVACSGLTIAYFALHGSALLFAIGFATSVADLVGASLLVRRVREVLPREGLPVTGALLRAFGAAAVMAGPAYLVAVRLTPVLRFHPAQVAMLAAAVVGGATYLLVQRLCRSPELAMLLSGRDGQEEAAAALTVEPLAREHG